MSASSPFPPFGNMYAPPWCSFSPVLKGVRDQEYDLDLPPVVVPAGTLPAGGFSRGNQLAVDVDADFLVSEIQFLIVTSVGAVLPSDLRVRIRDGDGRLFTSEFVPIFDIMGPLAPPWPVRRGSVLIIDYQNLQAGGERNSATVWMLLKGWKRKLCPEDPLEIASPYTPMYRRFLQRDPLNDIEEFAYPFTFTQAAAGDLFKIPLQTDNDADFLWRGICGDWNTANNDVQVVADVGLVFYDVDGVPLLTYPLMNPWGSLNAGGFRQIILSNGGGRPGPQFPEIFIPRGGVLQLDVSFGSAQTVRFSLRGVKVYGRCSL